MYNQTDPKYKNIILGGNKATGSIYQYGCYLVSLCNGLNQKGYNFTPEQLNQLFKDKNLWVGEFDNYIDVANVAKVWSDIFVSFDRIDPWGAEPITDTLINDQLVVLGKVNAAAIGGSGSHFVLIKGVQNGVAIIYDPWSGVEEPITKRWASFGCILGAYIFKVKPVIAPVIQPVNDQTKLPMGNKPDGTPWGNEGIMEVQAARSTMNDEFNQIKSLQQAAQNTPQTAPAPAPTVTPPTTPTPPETAPSGPSDSDKKLSQIRAVVYGKGWPWTKVAQVKALLPNQ